MPPVSDELQLVDTICHAAAPFETPTLSILNEQTFRAEAVRAPLLLVVFTTTWCARCVDLARQLQRASRLLKRLEPAMQTTIALVDVSDPSNRRWLAEEMQVPD